MEWCLLFCVFKFGYWEIMIKEIFDGGVLVVFDSVYEWGWCISFCCWV